MYTNAYVIAVYNNVFSFPYRHLGLWFILKRFPKDTSRGSDADFAPWFALLQAVDVRKRKVMKKWVEVCRTSFYLVIKECESEEMDNNSIFHDKS